MARQGPCGRCQAMANLIAFAHPRGRLLADVAICSFAGPSASPYGRPLANFPSVQMGSMSAALPWEKLLFAQVKPPPPFLQHPLVTSVRGRLTFGHGSARPDVREL